MLPTVNQKELEKILTRLSRSDNPIYSSTSNIYALPSPDRPVGQSWAKLICPSCLAHKTRTKSCAHYLHNIFCWSFVTSQGHRT